MNDKEIMMYNLNFEIDKKCLELQEKLMEKRLAWLFICGCLFLLTMPFIMFFTGINLFIVFLPVVVFFSISTLFLSPIIIGENNGGMLYE